MGLRLLQLGFPAQRWRLQGLAQDRGVLTAAAVQWSLPQAPPPPVARRQQSWTTQSRFLPRLPCCSTSGRPAPAAASSARSCLTCFTSLWTCRYEYPRLRNSVKQLFESGFWVLASSRQQQVALALPRGEPSCGCTPAVTLRALCVPGGGGGVAAGAGAAGGADVAAALPHGQPHGAHGVAGGAAPGAAAAAVPGILPK
jgi:hypothetical protein